MIILIQLFQHISFTRQHRMYNVMICKKLTVSVALIGNKDIYLSLYIKSGYNLLNYLIFNT